ncbi:MAG: peptidoglycan DD-metalloendopeptidase family protein [Bifidobacteriaceae bacterium]|nr:peptidoglycan DD-metalloendopeptidase family protein [Bifidobacteriaceae bacterium]
MKKILAGLAAGGLLLAPGLPLIAVGLLMNPAAKGSCVINTVTVGAIPDELEVETADGAKTVLNRRQLGHAATIIETGARTSGVGGDGIVVALMAALTESTLRMLSNVGAYPESGDYPNDGDGSDHDSLGLFQMRHETGWGTVADLMDPAYQARAFYGGPTGPNHPSPRGLLDVPGWETMPKGDAAQAVEASAYPDRYANWEPAAETVLAALTSPGGGGDPPGSGRVVFPLPSGTWVKTSPFGWRWHPILGTWRLHAGTDYSAADGTPILAAMDGQVVFAGPSSGYGNAIIVDHVIGGEPAASLYAHMWDGHLYVKAGDQVAAGQHIADVGSSGRSTGPHLHFEIRVGADRNQATDPDAWLAGHGAEGLGGPDLSAAGCHLEQAAP